MRARVQDLMTPRPKTCRASEFLTRAAQIMWEHDVGCVPVVDDQARLVGMITDRDLCMAAYTQGRRLNDILVMSVMAKVPISVRPDDEIAVAEERMRTNRVRRLPVVDVDGQVVGLIAMNDLIREARPEAESKGVDEGSVLDALREIGRPRTISALVARASVPREMARA